MDGENSTQPVIPPADDELPDPLLPLVRAIARLAYKRSQQPSPPET
jgi:hypothetical protein